jgi:hypothetical protein
MPVPDITEWSRVLTGLPVGHWAMATAVCIAALALIRAIRSAFL